MEKLRERIKEKMIEQGLNQAQLARNAGITPAALSQILSGDRTPSSPILLKIASALSVSVDYLVGNADESKLADVLENEQVQVLYREFSGLGKNDQEQVIDMIEFLKKKAEKKKGQ
jgi:transcriptional regulator with XRE-family HTH domain